MDRRLHLIDHLYGEHSEETPPLSELLSDPELKAEYRAISEARFVLDRRPRHRPERATIDAIVAEAAPKVLPSRQHRWKDRAPLALVFRHRRMSMSAVAMAAMLAFAVWMKPWSGGPHIAVPAAVAEADQALAPPESLLRALPPRASVTSASRVARTTWDEGEDIRQISRRIQALRAAGELDWDEPAVPLEMLPSGSGRSVRPASNRP